MRVVPGVLAAIVICSHSAAHKEVFNITGTYRGDWVTSVNETLATTQETLTQTKGITFLQIQSVEILPHAYHRVKGAIVLWDGIYNTDHDVQTVVQGVFHSTTGMLALSTGGMSLLATALPTGQNETLQWVSDESLHQNDVPACGIQASLLALPKSAKTIHLAHEDRNDEQPLEAINKQAASLAPLTGSIRSPQCGFSLSMEASGMRLDLIYVKAINYAFMVTTVSVAQVLLLLRQIEFTNSPSRAARISPFMIAQQAAMDAYLCLIHLGMGVIAAQVLFNAFATVAFFKFIVFAILEMRYLLVIWKARHPLEFNEGWEAVREQLCVLYLRFYGVLMLGLVIIHQFRAHFHVLILIFYSFWIPQIIENAINNHRETLHWQYVVGVTITRLAIPLYMYGCPDKFVQLQPSFSFCVVLCLYFGGQAVILLLQSHYGGRVIVPQRFLPEQYDYFRPIAASNFAEDCAICMSPLDPHNCMVTPCDHAFHTACLEQWLEQKLECPICRGPLPSI